MTTTVVYAGTNDGRLSSVNATYATCQAGSSLGVSTTGTANTLGQNTGYNILEAFNEYDTSSIPDGDTISSAQLDFCFSASFTPATAFTVEVRDRDWGGGTLTTGDWVTPATLAGLTILASLASSSVTNDGTTYNTITANGSNLASWVNRTGYSRCVICSDRVAAGTVPTNVEILGQISADTSGTTADPKLTVTHETPASQNVEPSAIASAEAFGSDAVNLTVAPSGIATLEAFGSPVLVLVISPSGITSLEAFGTTVLTPGPVSVSPSAIASGEAFGATSVSRVVAPTGIAGAEAFGSPMLALVLTASGIAGAEVFGTATLSPGPVSLSPAAISSAEAFGTSSLQQLVQAAGIASLEAFGTAVLQPGPVSISPSGIASAEALGSASVVLLIKPNGIGSAEAFGTATMAPGAVSITPSGIASAESFSTTIRITGGVQIDHWRDVREGDILQVLLPYAGFQAVCVLVRVIKRVYSDSGDGLLELEVQLLPPHAPGDNLTFVADTGPIPGPKPIVRNAVDVPAQIAQVNDQVAKLKSDVGIIQATS